MTLRRALPTSTLRARDERPSRWRTYDATRTIGFVFIEGFADWEFGFLSGSAPEWFGARPVALTPGGAPVVSIGAFQLAGQRGWRQRRAPISMPWQ
jgi:hypothetical protein